MKKFSEIIKKLRVEKGLTQEQLAEEIGVSKSTIAMWETGKREPSRDLYEEVADYFNVDIDYLYGRTNIRKAHHFDEDGNEYVNKMYVKESNDFYYLNDETLKIAQEIFERPELKALFHASRKAKPEDLKFIKDLLKRLIDEEGN